MVGILRNKHLKNILNVERIHENNFSPSIEKLALKPIRSQITPYTSILVGNPDSFILFGP